MEMGPVTLRYSNAVTLARFDGTNNLALWIGKNNSTNEFVVDANLNNTALSFVNALNNVWSVFAVRATFNTSTSTIEVRFYRLSSGGDWESVFPLTGAVTTQGIYTSPAQTAFADRNATYGYVGNSTETYNSRLDMDLGAFAIWDRPLSEVDISKAARFLGGWTDGSLPATPAVALTNDELSLSERYPMSNLLCAHAFRLPSGIYPQVDSAISMSHFPVTPASNVSTALVVGAFHWRSPRRIQFSTITTNGVNSVLANEGNFGALVDKYKLGNVANPVYLNFAYRGNVYRMNFLSSDATNASGNVQVSSNASGVSSTFGALATSAELPVNQIITVTELVQCHLYAT
jgi:hypothetical protein